MISCLYECTVFHRRLVPLRHEFVYRVFYFFLDLDELEHPRQAAWPPWPLIGVRCPALFSFYDQDHLGKRANAKLRPQLEDFLTKNGLPRPYRVRLLTNLRIFGYVFNPISIFFCEDEQGNALASVAQVGNTFGEQKLYLIPPRSDLAGTLERASPTKSYAARMPKDFYVSPFSDLAVDFDFRFDAPGERLRIAIDEYKGEDKILVSTLTGTRRSLSTGRLLWFLIKYPLLTLQVIFLIHWQAWCLYRLGLPFRRKEADLDQQRDVLNPRESRR